MHARIGSRLILIRHSHVQVDPSVPAKEWRLSADGRSRCYQLAPQLSAYQPTRFVTSTEPKAMETGQILAKELGAGWETAENLHEHERIGVPFYGSDEFEGVVADFFTRPKELVFGQETAEQALKRFDTAVHHILTADKRPQTAERNLQLSAVHYRPSAVAIVTHGTVLTLFICRYNSQIAPFPFWQSLTLPDAFVLSLPDFKLLDHTELKPPC